jgi:hypothetical protein
MTFNIDNMLEVAQLFMALEKQIKSEIEGESILGLKAITSIYIQFKEKYDGYFDFRY